MTQVCSNPQCPIGGYQPEEDFISIAHATGRIFHNTRCRTCLNIGLERFRLQGEERFKRLAEQQHAMSNGFESHGEQHRTMPLGSGSHGEQQHAMPLGFGSRGERQDAMPFGSEEPDAFRTAVSMYLILIVVCLVLYFGQERENSPFSDI